LIGNLGKDPEIRYTQSGKAVTSFSLATSEKWKGQDGQQQEATTWHNIVAWGRQAEVLKEYTGKGSKLYIEGRISNRTYDKKDGTKGFTSEVVVQNFQFLDAKKDATEPAQAAPNTEADDDLPF
jgi:single-strand DNA-binding protein